MIDEKETCAESAIEIFQSNEPPPTYSTTFLEEEGFWLNSLKGIVLHFLDQPSNL
jgi:hypothetical protein